MVLLGEVADLCAQDPGANYIPSGYSYMVQRSWSNTAVNAGKDFCQPSLPGDIYFNSVPVMNEALGPSRKAAAAAISSGVPRRPVADMAIIARMPSPTGEASSC